MQDINAKLDKMKEKLSQDDRNDIDIMQVLSDKIEALIDESRISPKAALALCLSVLRSFYSANQIEDSEEFDSTYEEFLIEHALHSLRIMREIFSDDEK